MNFKDLNIVPPILKALSKENYTTPTPIQQQAIPAVLEGRDLFGCAQTGTGKTAAFALPILQLLSAQQARPNTQRPIRSLILTPTRELAIQIADNMKAYGQFTNLRSSVIVGGVSQKAQEEMLARGTDVLIATPGRLIDLMNQGFADLRHVQILVLDEADRMLDMGFIHDMKRIIAKLPVKRQTLFFSATMPPEITSMVDSLLVNPVKIEITPVSSTVDRIEQSIYFVDKENKLNLLSLLLQDPSIASALVFTRTKHGADRVARGLTKAKVTAQAIHGDKSQNARQAALNNFKNGTTRVLVATDIAARGIDIEELSHVINFNLPNIPETYVHRIGRTGRAGHSGIAISFCEFEELPYLKDIEKLIKKTIPRIENHPYPMLNTSPAPKAAGPSGGGNGRQQGQQQQQPKAARGGNASGGANARQPGQQQSKPAQGGQAVGANAKQPGHQSRSAKGGNVSGGNVRPQGQQPRPEKAGGAANANAKQRQPGQPRPATAGSGAGSNVRWPDPSRSSGRR
ncbi:DEAD/DEAH box helicase [Cohnella nanjingensis]|uniref:ATP-dependent RNA helicase CshA n=1 Tax=Cohnella nanjingensis TaxID=1387779 RepID=A0A7X0RQY5_9BACL|nr:DEAD/DEAH box helicase [Cohnella nanjingensis]MBB6672033.1 DEAD/DEAH box helicase [Cohnella nanjingensis]